MTDNILAEFQMWFELADAGDSLSVQFYSGNNNDKPVYRGGLEWRGSANGKVASDWTLYRVYYPGLAKDNNTVWVQWQFSSDATNNPAKGPWLDDLAVSSYQKPQLATACERNDPTFANNQSKGLVLPQSQGYQTGTGGLFQLPNDRCSLYGHFSQSAHTGRFATKGISAAHQRQFSNSRRTINLCQSSESQVSCALFP